MILKRRFICFIGIDGSGKSTLAKMLGDDLRNNGLEVKYLWLRMNYLFSKPILLFCRIIGITNRPIINGKRISVHEFSNSPILANLIRLTHTFDTFLHFFIRIYLPLKFTKKVIICDRFIYDVFVDFSIECRRDDLFSTWLFIFAKRMTNKAILLLIDVPIQHIIERKPDVLDNDLSFYERFQFYKTISAFSEITIVKNDSNLEAGFEKIKKIIVDEKK